MLKIQEFLRAYQASVPNEEEFLDLILDKDIPLLELECKYGIKSKRHTYFPNLILLKYSQIESPMGEEIVKECRGIIVDEDDDYNVVAFPYKKFFNYGEGNADQIDWDSAVVYEKLDGSILTLYYYEERWNVSTSGTPDALCDINNTEENFEGLFWKTFKKEGLSIEVMDIGKCYMFELCAPENRVVVPHEDARLYLHGVRDLSTLQEEDPVLWGVAIGARTPSILAASTIDDVVASASTLNPMESEGYVVCDKYFSRLKVKSPAYVEIHRAKGGFSIKNIANLVRMGEGGEFLAYFPEMSSIYDDTSAKLTRALNEVCEVWESIKSIDDQKTFALQATKHKFSSMLFFLKKNPDSDLMDFVRNMTDNSYLEFIGEK